MAGLQNQIQQDLQAAMKAKEAEKLAALRLLKSDIQYELTKTGDEFLADEKVQEVIQKAVKKRQESVIELEKAGRTDEVEEENRAIALLKTYLPAEATDEEIQKVINELIQKAGDKASIGTIMGPAMGRLKGKADGSRVRSLVESALQGHGS